MMCQIIASGLSAILIGVTPALAGEVTVSINKISTDGVGAPIGTILLKDSHHGMMVTPNLTDLPPGAHAFHIHQNPNCGAAMKGGKKVAGLMAGGHYNPTKVGHGKGMKHGHGMKPHGDLPDISAGADGTATKGVMTDKVKVDQIRGRAIMIHRYGTNEAGKPKGGGARFACGIIPK